MASKQLPEQQTGKERHSISVLFVEQSRLFREGMGLILSGSSYNIVHEANSIEAASQLVERGASADLVLVDLSEHDAAMLEQLRRLRAQLPEARIVVLTGAVSAGRLMLALEAGCDAYLLKDISPEALIQSLRLTMLGEKVFPTNLAQMLIDGQLYPGQTETQLFSRVLSEREQQILRCLVNGDPNKVIAQRLHITESTVKVHLKGILRKIQVSNRTQAAIWAVENSLDKLPALSAQKNRAGSLAQALPA